MAESMTWQILNSVGNITSLYLYGQFEKPDLLSENIFREGESNNPATPGIEIEISNFYDFMTSSASPMRYANLSQVPLVQSFFDKENFDIPTGRYSLSQIESFLGVNYQYESYSMEQRNYDIYSSDFAQRTYIWNSQQIHINKEAIFVVSENEA